MAETTAGVAAGVLIASTRVTSRFQAARPREDFSTFLAGSSTTSTAMPLTYTISPPSQPPKPCQYALTLWKKLTRFLEHPELELSTNLAENSMRPVALGRKNWLHIGSPQAGPKVAAILSVVESCRRLQVPVRDYFSTVLPGLADLPIRCLPDLTPAVWVGIHRRKRPGY